MSGPEKPTDEELMRAYQGGDEMAFGMLYERYAARVYGFLRGKLFDRAALDDVFQATFLKLHQSRASYDSAYPFAPWLFTVCRNTLVDYQRKGARIREDLDPEAVEAAVAAETAREGAPLPSLAALPATQKSAVELRYFDDLSFEEIARRLETTPANVRQLVSRALRRLKKLSGRKGGPE